MLVFFARAIGSKFELKLSFHLFWQASPGAPLALLGPPRALYPKGQPRTSLRPLGTSSDHCKAPERPLQGPLKGPFRGPIGAPLGPPWGSRWGPQSLGAPSICDPFDPLSTGLHVAETIRFFIQADLLLPNSCFGCYTRGN